MNYDKNGLQSFDYEHSADKEALAVLRKVPFFDKIIGAYYDFCTQSSEEIIAKGDYCRVTAKTYPRVHRLYQVALERLNMECEPELYIKLSYDFNACAMGVKKCMIIIHSSCVQHMTDGELLSVLGHELGHIKSGHLVYYNLASSLNIIPKLCGSKIANILSEGLDYAIMDWRRKAEYTSDRAGMIASLDYEASKNEMLKLLGYNNISEKVKMPSTEDILNQNKKFEEAKDDVIGKLIYISQTANNTHPWLITRIGEIEKWYKSGGYNSLVTKYNIR